MQSKHNGNKQQNKEGNTQFHEFSNTNISSAGDHQIHRMTERHEKYKGTAQSGSHPQTTWINAGRLCNRNSDRYADNARYLPAYDLCE